MITCSTIFSDSVPFDVIQAVTLRLRDCLVEFGGLQSLQLEHTDCSSSSLVIRVSVPKVEPTPSPDQPVKQPCPPEVPARAIAWNSKREQVQSARGLMRFIDSLPRPAVVSSLRSDARHALLKDWLPAPACESDRHLRGKSIRALEAVNVTTVHQLIGMHVSELLEVSGIGTGSVRYFATHLAPCGQQFEAEQ